MGDVILLDLPRPTAVGRELLRSCERAPARRQMIGLAWAQDREWSIVGRRGAIMTSEFHYFELTERRRRV